VIREAGAPWTPRIAAEDIRRDARFIHEDVLARVVNGKGRPPLTAGGRDIRSPLFVGVYRFF
jgi:hypothetical protein